MVWGKSDISDMFEKPRPSVDVDRVNEVFLNGAWVLDLTGGMDRGPIIGPNYKGTLPEGPYRRIDSN